MAGIGFRLQKILSKDTYTDSMKAYFYSALIVSGPWILSILSMVALNYFTPKSIDFYELTFFRTTIVYVFAFSLIAAGFLYLSISRYLADKLYLKEEEAVVPIFNTVSLYMLIFQFITGSIFFFSQGIELKYALLSVLIYMVISMIWVVLVFLTALRDYTAVGRAYAMGTIITVISCIYLGNKIGLLGYFVGYLLGHFVIVVLLSSRIFVEFDSKRMLDRDLWSFLIRNKDIVLTGFFYNLAIWIDKILFWFSPKSVEIYPWMHTYPIYESAVFLSYLTIIPALSIFMVEIETDFYRKYKLFYSRVVGKTPLSLIKQAKQSMAQSLKRSIIMVIISQGGISAIAIMFTPEIVSMCRLLPIQIPLFRITVLGAFLHGLLLIAIIIILYFDLRKEAMIVSIVFCATNALFTWITLFLPEQFLGYGYFISCFISLITAFYLLNFKYSRLEYLTFALQPLGSHREDEVS
ncbi:MAG: exopolysaccharide Pel transporter PelG [Candidatus Omnitrophica bacterium]|nr:exopolysaccharide Pel transporter PelG [Candidatus Omnitrophota bacterium]